ncbi:MAG TPA: polysaccharide deacetylase family protein [Polyangia bacterium]|nr:polysaccharide deacetylase family protein [Polyangia bacterium]
MPILAVLTPLALHAAAAVHAFGPVAPFRSPRPPVEAPAPAAVPPPPPAPTPAMAPMPVHTLRPIGLVAVHEPAVAITFDACATRSHSYGFDRKVFDLLTRERIPATIFVSGRWVEGHPDVMAELAADPLVEFGDHSYDHPHMAHLPVARIVEEIDQTEAALAKYGKRSVAFRPPFGEWSHRLVYVVQDLQLPTVTWDVVSGDPSAHTTVDRMLHNVVDKARAGSIIIFHINGRGLKTADALPAIVHDLRARGFRFVLLSELMAAGRAAPAPIPVSPASAPAAISDPGPQ